MGALKDLTPLLNDVTNKVNDPYTACDIELSDYFKQSYRAFLNEKGDDIAFSEKTATVTNSTGLKIYVPNQWFVLASYAVPLIEEIMNYRNCAEAVIDNNPGRLCDDKGAALDKRGVYTSLRNGTDINLPQQFENLAEAHLASLGFNQADAKQGASLLRRFTTDYKWWKGGKGIERTNDYYVSPTLSALNLVNASQSFVAKVAFDFTVDPQLFKSFSFSATQSSGSSSAASGLVVSPQSARVTGAINLLVYGAPGTGKSRFVDMTFGKGLHERAVFHPEYTYSDFVGIYEPQMVYENDGTVLNSASGQQVGTGSPHIVYKFVPGAFTRILVDAWLNPSQMYTLIIEELNRANAAGVFGEIFQLLDRNPDGSSRYSFTPSENLREYLIQAGIGPFITNGVSLPSNLNIVATMNSADQGVHLLDTAFKRRWQVKYLRIDTASAVHAHDTITYAGGPIEWGVFVDALNSKLKQLRIPEDRLIAPYFISPGDLQDRSAIEKLLIYLWDDVLRHKRDQGVFPKFVCTFADLVDNFAKSDVLAIVDLISYPAPAADAAEAGHTAALEENVDDEAEAEADASQD